MNGKAIPAQFLYDLREEFEFVSGSDLHEFFAETVGDPSPAGRTEIPADAAISFVAIATCAMAHNNGSTTEWLAWQQEVLSRFFVPAN